MAIHRDHELHGRRWGRNLGLGLVLGGFVVLVFGLTIAKVSRQDEHGNPPGMTATTGADQ